jgi:hypothetical protein
MLPPLWFFRSLRAGLQWLKSRLFTPFCLPFRVGALRAFPVSYAQQVQKFF